jgi:hypothetical protein
MVVITLRFTPPWAVRGLTAVESFRHSQRRLPKFAALWARGVVAAAGLALCATATADLPAVRMRPIPTLVSRPDARIARLEKFFRIYHCPAPQQVSEYLRAADGFGLDYRLLPAVSIRETLCGRTEKQPHNPWGYHQESFPSTEIGIYFLAHRLTQHPFYKGKTLQDKLFTYNPRPAYPEEVKRIMEQIE